MKPATSLLSTPRARSSQAMVCRNRFGVTLAGSPAGAAPGGLHVVQSAPARLHQVLAVTGQPFQDAVQRRPDRRDPAALRGLITPAGVQVDAVPGEVDLEPSQI